jgi:hypothetical protein
MYSQNKGGKPYKQGGATMNEDLKALLTDIANECLGISTLETQDSDDADFHEVSVWSLKQALEWAYKAGQQNN